MSISFKKFYKGFRTRNYEEQGGYLSVYDVNCVEEDLLNEIFTLRGERLYMPEFGTRIPLLVFELGDSTTFDIIHEDLMTVFNNEPRVELLELNIIPAVEQNAMVALAKINYIEFQVTRDLRITVNSQ